MLLPATFLENTKNVYLPKLPKNWAWVYILLCIVICAAIASLPYLYVDISINATGIIRPSSERTEIKSSMSGIIDSVWVTEGAFVNKNQHIVSILNPHYHNKTKFLLFQSQSHYYHLWQNQVI
ncbi:MAG: hypothetical protein QM539_10890 [Alphaproteobacteria bacterium]|nr:hypothetical protein [Alphaproteobacteria bacterium]